MTIIVGDVKCEGFPVLTASTYALGSSLRKAHTEKGFLSLESLALHMFGRTKMKEAEKHFG